LILRDGKITIGYWEDGKLSTGNYIAIFSWGEFWVGEFYKKGGKKWSRGTQYNTDGTETKYD
jgi:hypothetical protein